MGGARVEPVTSRRRIWSELLPLDALRRDAATLEALAARSVELLAAVQPGQREDALALVAEASARGLSIGLWPLLADEAGRWLHPGNAGEFEAWIARLLEGLDGRGLSIDAVALDLEPPIAEVRRLTDGRLGAARAWIGRPLERGPHRRLVEALRGRGIESVATAIPPALLEGRAGHGWCRALGTPLDVAYDRVSTMTYTSLFEGYSFGAVDRPAARALLARFAALTARSFGARASVSLGAVGVGALGDERRYRDPSELADDVAIARAAGVDDLALFDLAGVLARPPIEAWLDAFVETPPAAAAPPPTARAAAVVGGLAVTGVALDVLGRR